MFRAICERKIYRIINYGILLKWRDYSFFTLYDDRYFQVPYNKTGIAYMIFRKRKTSTRPEVKVQEELLPCADAQRARRPPGNHKSPPKTEKRGPPQIPREEQAVRPTSQTPAWPELVSAIKCAPDLVAHSGAEESPYVATPVQSAPLPLPRAISLERSTKRPSEDAPSRGQEWAPSRRLPGAVQSAGGKTRPPAPSPVFVACAGGQPHNSAPHLSQPWPQSPSPPRAGARTRGPEGAPCQARAPRRGSRGGPLLTGERAGRGGPREPTSRPGGARCGTRESSSRGLWQDAPGTRRTTRARRGTAHSGSGAGRSGPARPGGPASRRRPGAAHLCPRVLGDESPPSGRRVEREQAPCPPPQRCCRGATHCPGVRPAPRGYLVLLPAVADGGPKEVGSSCDSLRAPLVATEKV